MTDLLAALDYPEELEPVMRAYHEARHEWLALELAYARVVDDYNRRVRPSTPQADPKEDE